MMKIIQIQCIILFALNVACNAQSTVIDTFTGDLEINGEIIFNHGSIQELENHVGAPNEISTEHWEMSNQTVTVYSYENGGEFYFAENVLQKIVITSPSYTLTLGSYDLQVGEPISSIQSGFPKSYSYRKSGNTTIALGAGDHHYLVISYNENNIITILETRVF